MRLQEILFILSQCPLFQNIPEEDLEELITFLHGFVKTFRKNDLIIGLDEPFRHAGVVLSGKIEVSYTNNRFDKLNVNHFSPSNIFGEALALKKTTYSPVQVQAVSDSMVLFLDLNYLFVSTDRCCATCSFHHQLLLNIIQRMVNQNLFTNLKLRILSQKSLRDKILVYLYSIHPDKKNARTVPFSQTALAEFLNVNRSALSRELGRMQDEGILRIHDRSYTLISSDSFPHTPEYRNYPPASGNPQYKVHYRPNNE